MNLTTKYTFPELKALAKEHVAGERCEHGYRYNVNNDGLGLVVTQNGAILRGCAIAGCDVGCGRDFNIAL